MSFVNHSPFAALDAPVSAPDGRAMAIAVIKGTFTMSGALNEAQAPVLVGDVRWLPDQEEESSIRWPSDLVLSKRGVDVVVVGSARSHRAVRRRLVVVRVGDRELRLVVHGERMFYRGLGGRVAVGEAGLFTSKPITYERAFGGSAPDGQFRDARNPVGRGFAPEESVLVDTPAPQIELESEPITTAGFDGMPAGLGAIAANWQSRTVYAGTFDEAWQAERMPLMPLDFDERFNNCAHPSLQFENGLAPETPLGIQGMTEDGDLAFALPALDVRVLGLFDDGTRDELRPAVDTVVVDTDGRLVQVSARAAFTVGRGVKRLRAMRVEHG